MHSSVGAWLVTLVVLGAVALLSYHTWLSLTGRVICPSCGRLIKPLYKRRWALVETKHIYICHCCRHWASGEDKEQTLEHFKGNY